MILNILENMNYNFSKNKQTNININFKYRTDLLINKNEISLKKIIASLNKMTENNYYNIYFNIIDILNDNDLNVEDIVSFIFKKIDQNPNFVDVYIKFISLNKRITMSFINLIQNKYENNLGENFVVIKIIYYFYQNKIFSKQLLENIIEYLFQNPKENIDFIIEFYKYSKEETLKIKILDIPNLSYRYKFKLEC